MHGRHYRKAQIALFLILEQVIPTDVNLLL